MRPDGDIGARDNLGGEYATVVCDGGRACAIAGAANANPVQERLDAAADNCVRANAPTVDGYSHSMTESVGFLVDSLCAIQIQHAEMYRFNSQVLAGWRAKPAKAPAYVGEAGQPLTAEDRRIFEAVAKTNSQIAGITIDPDTGDMITPPDFVEPEDSMMVMSSVLRRWNKDSRYRAIAAEAILAAKHRSERH